MELDYEELAAAVAGMREALRAMVAGLVADGFSDEQARQLVVAMYTRETGEEDE